MIKAILHFLVPVRFPPATEPSEGRVWRKDWVRGWQTVCNGCFAVVCQCSGNHKPKAAYMPPEKQVPAFTKGDRVRVGKDAGFSRGSIGTIEFVEPNGKKVWVTRDRSGGPCFFYADELEPYTDPPKQRTKAKS